MYANIRRHDTRTHARRTRVHTQARGATPRHRPLQRVADAHNGVSNQTAIITINQSKINDNNFYQQLKHTRPDEFKEL